MSRARDLRAFQPQSPSTNDPPSRPQPAFRSPASIKSNQDFREREDPSTAPGSAPPMRPQRSAARQPGITISNLSSHPDSSRHQHPLPGSSQAASYDDDRHNHTRGRSDSSNRLPSSNQPRPAPSGSNNKLYQAINSRPDVTRAPNSASRAQANGNGYLDRNYHARNEAHPVDSRTHLSNDNDKRPSTASSTTSADNEANRDLLSAHDLKDAKRMHGARNIIEAFSNQADKRSNQRTRLVRSPPRMEQADSRTIPSMFNDQSYPRTAGFGEIERVLQKIKIYWDATGIAGSSNSDDPFGYSVTSPTTPFSAVGLALDLLDSENPELAESASRAKAMINKKGGVTPSLSSFLQLKAELEKALQLTIQGNYRQFDASVNCYKLAKVSVESNYKKVAELKSKLLDCRATLGNGSPSSAFNNAVGGKGTEMKVLQARREVLREMLKLIDTIERLKQVPERLENLISSKSFLSATVLLVRSLKVINKPEFAEIGGLCDLRSYLVNQESVMFEMLIEELHNHLYLKNFFCNTKWRAYRPGQNTLPVINAPDESATTASGFSFEPDLPAADSLSSSYHATVSSSKHTHGQHGNAPSSPIPYLRDYLNDLMTQPQSNPLIEEADLFLELSPSSLHSEVGNAEHSRRMSTSNSGISAAKKRKNQPTNPELDSFKYIESLIESFAVLGKLSLGLDTVLQRVPVEVYTLVESTLNEVDERHENTKRFLRSSSANKNLLKSNMNMIILMITSSHDSSPAKNVKQKSAINRTSQRFSLFKFNNNELMELETVIHILQDFFWTLYSKFDGTLQSFRVLHEVSLRISERKSFKEEGIDHGLVLFSLLEVWKPIQSELLALIHAYLTESEDDQFSSADKMQANSTNKASSTTTTSTSRNPMASIADVLKIGLGGTTSSTTNTNTTWKDSNKQLFKFKDAGLKQNQKDFKAHEANLYSALKVSVPGLVLDSTVAGNSQANGAVVLTTGVMMTDDNSGGRGNSTHKLLVQPDAFHIAHLFKPTLEFLKRAKEVLPSGVVMVSNDDPSHSSLLPSMINSGIDEPTLTHSTSHGEDGHWEENPYQSINLAQFGGFSGFLDEFVLHTFLPQLEEKVIFMFEHSVNAPDAFQDDISQPQEITSTAINSASSHRQKLSSSPVPVAKSLRAIVALIECLGSLLQSTSFHQEKFGRLMISIVVQYYQKCHERFKELVVRESTETNTIVDESNPHANLKLAADWAQKPDIIKSLQELKSLSSCDNTSMKKLLKKLCKIEDRYLSSRDTLVAMDLIQSPKKLAALAHLYNTLLSFISFIRRLGSTVKPIPDSSEVEPTIESDRLEADWSKEFGQSNRKTEHLKSSFRMPLTYALMRRFQLVHRSFSTLAQTILFTIHLEFRLETYYHIDQTFVRGNYFLSRSDSIEPDLKIIELNSLINSYSENSIIKNFTRASDRRFPFMGLVNLIDDLMIINVKKLKTANEIGFKKLTKNSIALQQNMKSILLNKHLLFQHLPQDQDQQHDSKNLSVALQDKSPLPTFDLTFERCRKFWEIASKGPQAVMGSIRRGDNYKFEEYRQLLELLCMNESQSGQDDGHGGNNKSREDQTDSSVRASLKFPTDFHADQNCPSIEKRKRIYNECLIELHALVLEDDDDDDDDHAEDGEGMVHDYQDGHRGNDDSFVHPDHNGHPDHPE
ncbi:hypothetical protein PSTG_09550 [Puccinia striiformis f. sp. tritici PST-78]|uniref:Exocyst complex component Sec8 n=1 Tax=Puccinia striiformis f. sp. tritici PST-78 TaxID=1165861 RepID=A0A0L0VDS6_9BASI|nr:hypothetical protein PSTG_09550 [Puccinia striiformis f. sp. tritici PST-78]